MEPEFTRGITSRFICDYLYFYFWLAVVVSGLSLLGSVGAAIAVKGPLVSKIFIVFPYLIMAALGVLTALSLYVMCERSLHPEDSSNKGGRSAEGYMGGKKY